MFTAPNQARRRFAPGGGWLVTLLLALAGLVAMAPSVRAANAVLVENARVGFGERFKTGSWTPVWVQLRGGPSGFTGLMEVLVEDEAGTETIVRQRVQLAAGQSQRVTVYVRPGSMISDFARLVFRDETTGRRVADDTKIGALLDANPPRSLTPDDLILLALGKVQGLNVVSKLPGFNAERNAGSAQSRAVETAVAQPSVSEDLLPGRWYGYDAVDVVALDTNDREMLAAVAGPRGEALRRWVERGGHLVVAVNSNWQAVSESWLGPILPAKLTGQLQIEPWDALEAFAGGSKPVAAAEANQTRVAKLEDIEARRGEVIAATLSTPLIVRGPYGFGRITVIGVDVDTNPFQSWTDRGLFWVKALDLRSPPGDGGNSGVGPSGRLVQNEISDMATRLIQSLEQFEGVTLVPFGWVAGFIFLYILLIGPGDYFFLKKVVKRMELTWITFPTIVVTVSLLAYYAAYRIKGSDLRVNKLDIVDVDQVAGRVRGSTWFNVFSPQNRDYGIAVAPLPLDRPTDESADPPTPPGGTETVVSWFGAPDSGLRGTNSQRGGFGLGESAYSYNPIGRMEQLDGVRVKIWSTKAFSGRWDGPTSLQPIESNLSPVGTDRLEGSVTNRLDIPLRDVMIAYNNQIYFQVGTIEPGATVQVDATLNRYLSNHLQESRQTFLPVNNYTSPTDTIDRANLARELMFHDSDQSGQEPVRSRALRDVDLSGQLALNRPMLVAQIDRPASRLVLGNAVAAPKVDQTTLIRVILPLKPQPQAAK